MDILLTDVITVYNIESVNPEQWREIPILADYVKNLFYRPYCTDSKGFCERLGRGKAIKYAYIQPNQPSKVTYIVLDIDHSNGIHSALYESELPPPHLIIQNTENAHVHLVYKLCTPVATWGNAKEKPMNYLARIERGMVRALGADASYGGNLMKNPLNGLWRTYTTTAPLEGYELKNLGQFVDLNDLPDAANDAGYQRNCTLFDKLRHYGYKHESKSYSALVEHLTPIANEINSAFPDPLLPNEVKHIIRSIARYCSRRAFIKSHKEFSNLQSVRSKRRWGDNTEKKKQAQLWLADGMKIGVIAEQLDISPRTLTRWGVQRKRK